MKLSHFCAAPLKPDMTNARHLCEDSTRSYSARKSWQWLTLLGGLALVATFCVEYRGFRLIISPITGKASPLSCVITMLQGQRLPVPSCLGVGPTIVADIGLYTLPHLIGLPLALYSAISLAGLERLAKAVHVCGAAVVGSCSLGLVFGAALLIPTFVRGAGSLLFEIVAAAILFVLICGIPFLLLIHAWLAVRRGSLWTYLYHSFTASAIALWFAGRSTGHVFPELLGGTGLAFVAACVLFIARIGEARAITRLSWPRTLAYLLILRLSKPPAGSCPRCGYRLYGLPDMRCPECGRPFTSNELGSTVSA